MLAPHIRGVCASLRAFEPSERDSLCARQSVRACVLACVCACVCVGALCACVCVCLCVPVHACVHKFKCLCVHECVRAFLSVRTHFLRVCNCACACLCLRVSVCVRASERKFECVFVARGWVGHCGCFVFASLTQIITDCISVPYTSLHFWFLACVCVCERDR